MAALPRPQGLHYDDTLHKMTKITRTNGQNLLVRRLAFAQQNLPGLSSEIWRQAALSTDCLLYQCLLLGAFMHGHMAS